MTQAVATAPATLVICVHYRSDEATLAFVGDLLAQTALPSLTILVVDNSAADGRPLAELRDSRVRITRPRRNLGYFGGAAFGLEEQRAKGPVPTWVAVSNPDIRFPDQKFFSDLYALYPEAAPAVIAPSILLRPGVDQNPFMSRRPTARRMQLYKSMFRYFPVTYTYELLSRQKERAFALRARWGRSTTLPPRQPRTIYAPHGSFLLFHHSYFDAGGTLQHGAFLFGEEVSVAERVRRLGLQTVYDPRLRVAHAGHATIGSRPSRQIVRHIKQASAYVADEYFR